MQLIVPFALRKRCEANYIIFQRNLDFRFLLIGFLNRSSSPLQSCSTKGGHSAYWACAGSLKIWCKQSHCCALCPQFYKVPSKYLYSFWWIQAMYFRPQTHIITICSMWSKYCVPSNKSWCQAKCGDTKIVKWLLSFLHQQSQLHQWQQMKLWAVPQHLHWGIYSNWN